MLIELKNCIVYRASSREGITGQSHQLLCGSSMGLLEALTTYLQIDSLSTPKIGGKNSKYLDKEIQGKWLILVV